MSRYGKINLWAALGLPLLAVFASLLVFGVRLDTQFFILGTNAIPMLIGGVVSGMLLRTVKRKGGGREFIALLPTLVPAGFGLLWYVGGLLLLGSDAGREYFAGPFYLLGLAAFTALVATLICLIMPAAKPAT